MSLFRILLKVLTPAPLLVRRPPLIIDGRKLDPKARVLAEILSENQTAPHSWDMRQMRIDYDASAGGMDAAPPGRQLTRKDLAIAGPESAVGLRLYRPAGREAEDLPVVLYFHGGGMAIGSIHSHDTLCARLCVGSEMAVLSVDYRLAPEHPFPAALEDVQAVYSWLLEQGAAHRLDPARIALAGDSAGGNLVAALLHLLIYQDQPLPRAQVLLYPWTDMRMDYPSMHSMAQAPVLTREAVLWFRTYYVSPDVDVQDPRVSPVHSPTHPRQPPAYVITCGHDPLRDMGNVYATHLADAGVAVIREEYGSMIHAFMQSSLILPAARQAMQRVCQWLKHTV
ncbi:MAG: alpha/beta hydrolase [Candidatus Sericytochromatia bacterium]|nr:alpha/beta hydrolase [Candidatus Sericytochromatia bacterium]